MSYRPWQQTHPMDVKVPRSSLRGTARGETTPLLESGPGSDETITSPRSTAIHQVQTTNIHKDPQRSTNYHNRLSSSVIIVIEC